MIPERTMTVHELYCDASKLGLGAECLPAVATPGYLWVVGVTWVPKVAEIPDLVLGKSGAAGDNRTMQIDSKTLDALARRLAQAVPPGLNSLGDELERNLKAVLQSGLKNLDLVTREEFEVQRGVLARTRERLEQLQARLTELEEGLKKGS